MTWWENFVLGINQLIDFMMGRQDQIIDLTLQHFWLVLVAMIFAIVIGVVMP